MAIAVGLRKSRGHPVTKRTVKSRYSARKAHCGPYRKLVKEVIADVAGHAPYERRVMELLRNGLDKRALKLAKRKLGTHVRAKRKREELSLVVQKARLERQAQRAEHDEAIKKAKREKKERIAKAKVDKKKAAAAENKAKSASAAASKEKAEKTAPK